MPPSPPHPALSPIVNRGSITEVNFLVHIVIAADGLYKRDILSEFSILAYQDLFCDRGCERESEFDAYCRRH